jgi:cell division protein FtsA
VVAPYAAGLAALVEDEMDLGVTVIDLGGGVTSMAVFFDGHVVWTDSMPVGGGHVTSDIARGLSTPSRMPSA